MSSSSLKSRGRLVECQSWPGVGEWGCHYSLCPCFLMSLMLVQGSRQLIHVELTCRENLNLREAWCCWCVGPNT
jgi:hypothetical protein